MISDKTNGSDISAFERITEDSMKNLPTLKLYASNDVGQSEKEIHLLCISIKIIFIFLKRM